MKAPSVGGWLSPSVAPSRRIKARANSIEYCVQCCTNIQYTTCIVWSNASRCRRLLDSTFQNCLESRTMFHPDLESMDVSGFQDYRVMITAHFLFLLFYRKMHSENLHLSQKAPAAHFVCTGCGERDTERGRKNVSHFASICGISDSAVRHRYVHSLCLPSSILSHPLTLSILFFHLAALSNCTGQARRRVSTGVERDEAGESFAAYNVEFGSAFYRL